MRDPLVPTGTHLSLALSEIDIVVITKTRIQTIILLCVGDVYMETKHTPKYIRVTINMN